MCVPCDVEYDVILKLETHDDDTEFLIRQYNLTELQVGLLSFSLKMMITMTIVTQEPFTMWKHKSNGENQLGDYDYYLYEDPRWEYDDYKDNTPAVQCLPLYSIFFVILWNHVKQINHFQEEPTAPVQEVC